MSTAPQRRLTPDEYLVQERASDVRHEYYRGEVSAMSGASWEHTLIKDNVARQAGLVLESGRCQVLTSDLRVKVSATGLYTYPDVVIVCDEPQLEDSHFDTLLNPKVIVEVLSDSTEKYDRGAKFANYRQLQSMQEYVLISQDRVLVERFVRQEDDSWSLTVFDNLAGQFSFGTVPAGIPMAAIYRGVTIPG